MARPKATFKSYVEEERGVSDVDGKEEGDTEEVKASKFYAVLQEQSPSKDSMLALKPRLLPGETIVTSAHHVVRFPPHSEHKHGITGVLFCTNFKVTFVSPGAHEIQNNVRHRNKLIGEHDIALGSIDAVYQVSSSKRKKLQQGTAIAGVVKNIEIHCKDFRIHTFNFKMCAEEEAKMMANAIVHYAFPSGVDLLFAFEYKTQPPRLEPKQPHRGVAVPTTRWRELVDWKRELDRLSVIGFKETLCNNSFRVSDTMPESFVVPSSLKDSDILGAAQSFVERRVPVWCYSHANGAAILRMAYLDKTITTEQVEELMLQAIQDSHPTNAPPYVFDLTRDLPSIKKIQSSYERLREICMPYAMKELSESDGKWFGALHESRWLQHVMSCLNAAIYTVNQLTKRETVVLKELECRDLSAVVSSLAQILLDPYYRTQAGFQSLIEKEWVIMGHRFVDRLGLVTNPDAEPSSVILLFLDCVWQIMNQFPSAFQFSALYLTIVWDSICLGFFENFIFNSRKGRMTPAHRGNIYYTIDSDAYPNLMSVWDWTVQFDRDDMSLFNNPLYLTRTELKADLAKIRFADTAAARLTRGTQNGRGDFQNKLYARNLNASLSPQDYLGVDPDENVLRPVARAPMMKFWAHCYLRWLAPIQIITGGSPVEYLQQCILVEEIICLQHKMQALQNSKPFDRGTRKNSELIFSAMNVPQTPKSRHNWSNMVTSSFPYAPAINAGHLTDFGTPLKKILERSLVVDSDEEASDGDNFD